MYKAREFYLLPVNGLINRTRAIASAHIFALEFGMKFRFLWPDEEIMNCDPSDIYSTRYVSKYYIKESEFVPSELFEARNLFRFGIDGCNLLVAGGRDGEQRFIPQLKSELQFNSNLLRISIKSGGLFHACRKIDCLDCDTFREKRREVYNEIGTSQTVLEEIYEMEKGLAKRYVGVHLRLTDKSHQKVKQNRMLKEYRKRLSKLGEKGKLPDLIICGDEAKGIENLKDYFQKNGVRVFSRSNLEFDRSKRRNTISAFADWHLLAKCISVIFVGNTSFAYEAIVLGGTINDSTRLNPRFVNTRARIQSWKKRITWFIPKS